jgi:hypothetical protein
VNRPEARRGLRQVKRRQAELAARAALQRAELARKVEGLSGVIRWAAWGWAFARALRAGLSLRGADRAGSTPSP